MLLSTKEKSSSIGASFQKVSSLDYELCFTYTELALIVNYLPRASPFSSKAGELYVSYLSSLSLSSLYIKSLTTSQSIWGYGISDSTSDFYYSAVISLFLSPWVSLLDFLFTSSPTCICLDFSYSTNSLIKVSFNLSMNWEWIFLESKVKHSFWALKLLLAEFPSLISWRVKNFTVLNRSNIEALDSFSWDSRRSRVVQVSFSSILQIYTRPLESSFNISSSWWDFCSSTWSCLYCYLCFHFCPSVISE